MGGLQHVITPATVRESILVCVRRLDGHMSGYLGSVLPRSVSGDPTSRPTTDLPLLYILRFIDMRMCGYNRYYRSTRWGGGRLVITGDRWGRSRRSNLELGEINRTRYRSPGFSLGSTFTCERGGFLLAMSRYPGISDAAFSPGPPLILTPLLYRRTLPRTSRLESI